MKKLISTLKYVIPTSLLVLIFSFMIVTTTQAGTLAAVYVFLSRLKINLNGTGDQAVEIILAIDPSTAVASGSTIKIEFPDAEDAKWCRAAGALTVTGVASSPVDLSGGNWAIDAALPANGTLAAACTQGSSGTVDTITISNVGALTAGTTYGVKISGSTGKIGTDSTAGEHILNISINLGGVPVDSKSVKIILLNNDAVVITATVENIPSVSCTITSNAVNLGILYPGGTYVTGSHAIKTTTTSNGYYWAAYGTGDNGVLGGNSDAGLWNGTTLIRSGSTQSEWNDRLDLSNPQLSGFGLTVSDPDGPGANTATVPTNFQDSPAGWFGIIDRLYAGAKVITYQYATQTTEDIATITYGAKAQSDAIAGEYQETVYLICGGYY